MRRQHLPNFTRKDGLIASIILFVIVVLLAGYAPVHWWIEYERLEAPATASTTNNLMLTSYSAIPRGGEITWRDNLKCDFGEGFGIFSTSLSSAKVSPKPLIAPGTWTFQGELPQQEAPCFMDSTISTKAFWFFTKTEQVSSNVIMFLVTEDEEK